MVEKEPHQQVRGMVRVRGQAVLPTPFSHCPQGDRKGAAFMRLSGARVANGKFWGAWLGLS